MPLREVIDTRDKGSAFALNRPRQKVRPCDCGCDTRDDPNLVGYIMEIVDGLGYTLKFYDETEFRAAE